MKENKYFTDGILLDSYNLFIEWDITEDMFLEKTKNIRLSKNEHKDIYYCGYRLESKIWDSTKKFILTYHFVKNKLTEVNISDNEDADDLVEKYNSVQDFLQEKLGEPYRKRETAKEKTSLWKNRKVKIKHSLAERFSMSEFLEINIR